MRGGEWGPVHLGYESSWLPVLVELPVLAEKKNKTTKKMKLVAYH